MQTNFPTLNWGGCGSGANSIFPLGCPLQVDQPGRVVRACCHPAETCSRPWVSSPPKGQCVLLCHHPSTQVGKGLSAGWQVEIQPWQLPAASNDPHQPLRGSRAPSIDRIISSSRQMMLHSTELQKDLVPFCWGLEPRTEHPDCPGCQQPEHPQGVSPSCSPMTHGEHEAVLGPICTHTPSTRSMQAQGALQELVSV